MTIAWATTKGDCTTYVAYENVANFVRILNWSRHLCIRDRSESVILLWLQNSCDISSRVNLQVYQSDWWYLHNGAQGLLVPIYYGVSRVLVVLHSLQLIGAGTSKSLPQFIIRSQCFDKNQPTLALPIEVNNLDYHIAGLKCVFMHAQKPFFPKKPLHTP